MNTHELKEILERLELNSLHSTVDFVDLYEAASRRPSFTFTGEFSSGKTSLIEQLLGETIGKVDILEATRLPILFVYGTQKRAYGFQNEKQVEMINFEELNGASGQLNSPYDWLLVSLPNEILKTFNIVDTPGTNGSSTHQVSFVPNLQYVFCSPYGEVMTETKQQTLEKLGNQDIYFVATKADLLDLDEQEEIEEMHEEILEDYSFKDQIIYSVLETEVIEHQRELETYLNDWTSNLRASFSQTIVLEQIADTLKETIVNKISKVIMDDTEMMKKIIVSSKKQNMNEPIVEKEHAVFKQSVLNTWRVFYSSNGDYDKNKIIQDIEDQSLDYKKTRYVPRLLDEEQYRVITSSTKTMMELKLNIINLISKCFQSQSSWMYDQRQNEIMKGYIIKIDEKHTFMEQLKERSMSAKLQIELMDFEKEEFKNALEIFLDKRWYANLKTSGSFTYDVNIPEHYVFVPKLDIQNVITTHSHITNIKKLEQTSSNISRSHMLQTLGNGVYNSPKTLKINLGLGNLHGQDESSPWRANRLLLKQLKETKRSYLNTERQWFLNQYEHREMIKESQEVIKNKIIILRQITDNNVQSKMYVSILKDLLHELETVFKRTQDILKTKTYTYNVSSESMKNSPNISQRNYFMHQFMYPAFFVQSIFMFVLFYFLFTMDLAPSEPMLGYIFPSYFINHTWFIPSVAILAIIMTYVQHRMEDRKHSSLSIMMSCIYGMTSMFLLFIFLSNHFK